MTYTPIRQQVPGRSCQRAAVMSLRGCWQSVVVAVEGKAQEPISLAVVVVQVVITTSVSH